MSAWQSANVAKRSYVMSPNPGPTSNLEVSSLRGVRGALEVRARGA